MSDKDHAIEYSVEEAALRRDEVIRRMANTPPQPKVTTPNRRPRTEMKAGEDRAAGKPRAGHGS